ncbi:hypothetical protein XELAEV_18040248mg [Xenopus laevis]|uniref:Uncharacterized protein n=1 Tax=Xenopus laevis TaxID=8355 RepID=A0A974CA99_XENLA|nr:hypothetical protein XELAEV_18040248mg [Xenopus laevis]
MLSTIKIVGKSDLRKDNQTLIILNINQELNNTIKNSLTVHLLQSAKSLIPAKWKLTQPPSFLDWFAKVEEIRRLKVLTLILLNNSSEYWKIRSPC